MGRVSIPRKRRLAKATVSSQSMELRDLAVEIRSIRKNIEDKVEQDDTLDDT